jgi:NAD(P)-dependent dehydrogenase (short-subunit alcohol dehydrogenase family)
MALNIDLGGLRALVSGASSGIGAGISATLAQAGCDVAGCGLEAADSAGAQSFHAAVAQHGRRAVYQTVDLTDGPATRAWVQAAGQALGGIDLVISNAGGNVSKSVERCTEEEWRVNAELNLAAHWRIAQSAKPYLDHSPSPVVIVIASNQAFRPLRNAFPYNAAKAGLLALVQSLAIEWGPHVRAAGIAPGFVDTPMNDVWFNAFPDPAAKRAQAAAIHPLKRIGTPADIGALCAFLCSPLAAFITGTTILIDGGRSALLEDV